jgi:hypothetical protein
MAWANMFIACEEGKDREVLRPSKNLPPFTGVNGLHGRERLTRGFIILLQTGSEIPTVTSIKPMITRAFFFSNLMKSAAAMAPGIIQKAPLVICIKMKSHTGFESV